MSNLLDTVAKDNGGMKELGCRLGKSYNTLSVYSHVHKDDLPEITAYAVKMACQLFEKENKRKTYLAAHNGVIVKFEIYKG